MSGEVRVVWCCVVARMLGCRCWTVAWFAIVLLWWIWRQKSGGSGGCHVAAWFLPCQWLLLVVRVFNRLKEVILNLLVSIKSERQNLPQQRHFRFVRSWFPTEPNILQSWLIMHYAKVRSSATECIKMLQVHGSLYLTSFNASSATPTCQRPQESHGKSAPVRGFS